MDFSIKFDTIRKDGSLSILSDYSTHLGISCLQNQLCTIECSKCKVVLIFSVECSTCCCVVVFSVECS